MFVQEDEALELVTDGFQVQGERRAHHPKAAHQFASHLRQSAEYMLDAGAWRGDRAVALFLRLENAFGCMASALYVHASARLLQPAFPFKAGIAPVGIHIAACIVQVEQFFEYGGVRTAAWVTRIIGQVLQLLQHQNLNHQDCRTRRPPAPGMRWTRCGGINACSQCFEIDVLGEAHQGIAYFCAPVFTLLLGKKADPGFHHDDIHWLGSTSGFSQPASRQPRFFEVSLIVQSRSIINAFDE